MDKLKLFYDDEITRETVKAWLMQCSEEWVLKQLQEDKEVQGYSTAVKIINDSFIKLDEKFGEVKRGSNVNQAK